MWRDHGTGLPCVCDEHLGCFHTVIGPTRQIPQDHFATSCGAVAQAITVRRSARTATRLRPHAYFWTRFEIDHQAVEAKR
jgi:hypothetical protein